MAPPPSSPASASSKVTRAKHACRVCNSRRVKCNVMQVQPCNNCVAAGATCEIIPSRRGRYPRRSRRNQDQQSTGADASSVSASFSPRSTAAPPPPTILSAPAPSVHSKDVAQPSSPAEAIGAQTSPSPSPGLFFGESNFLTLVPGAVTGSTQSRSRQRLVFPVPDTPQSQGSEGSGVSAATMRYLRDEGALTLPDLQTCVPALQAYFTWFHPCFPIVDREEVVRRLAAMDISRTLLQAMLFVGATYCNDETITAMGFADRSEAKKMLYEKTRMLFHSDWEKDRITLIQSLFLISFWRGGPSDIRDVRYWLGVVLTLAESYGLHRSEKNMSKNPRLSRLKKRIWWSIYVRERQAAASLGLPSRIRDEDCDIEPLTAADWESETENTTSTLFGSVQPQQITYVIKMAEIAKLMGRVIDVQFVPGQRPATTDHIEAMDNALEEWRLSIPDDMQYSSDEGNSSIWTSLLHLAYNHLRILIHRNSFQRYGEENKSNQAVVKAACRISRTVEDMSAQGTLRYGQMHLITSLFAALCIHAIGIRRNIGMSQRIAEHRAQLCLLCLKEIQKYWRINNNVLDLFLHYLDSSIAKRLHGPQPDNTQYDHSQDPGEAPASAQQASTSAHTQPALDDGDASGGLVGGEGKQQRPPMDLFEDQLNLINGNWEGDDALGDLSLFLGGHEFLQGEGLDFLERSL